MKAILMRHIIVALTGASGAAYGLRLLERLAGMEGLHVHLAASEAFAQVLREEAGVRLDARRPDPSVLWKGRPDRVTAYDLQDIGAPIASGSFRTEGMAVVPCSLGRVGALATGMARDLIDRAAAVCLKERRRLVLVPRETPLDLIALENLARLCRAGAVILPACPGFYRRPESVMDLVDFVVDRILDHLGAGEAAREGRTDAPGDPRVPAGPPTMIPNAAKAGMRGKGHPGRGRDAAR